MTTYRVHKLHKLVSQENPLGCAVACVASQCHITYQQALQLFDQPDYSWTRGFYCSEIVRAFAKVNLEYSFEKYEIKKHAFWLEKAGTIVFIAPNAKYPAGHYFLRLPEGWMNPWANFPQMIPVQSALEKNIEGEILYVVFSKMTLIS